MTSSAAKTRSRLDGRSRSGFALLLAMVVLVVLASVAAGLSVQLTMAKRRQQYRIEYSRARYGLDSAMKYILSVMPTKTFQLQPRPDAPDFSDLFWMSDADYGQFIEYWASTATEEQIRAAVKEDAFSLNASEETDSSLRSWLNSLFGSPEQPSQLDPNGLADPNAANAGPDYDGPLGDIDPNQIEVPGPYGVPWPYVIEPIKLKIGTSNVTITIEDENAKMPLSWMVTNFQKVNEQAEYSLETFAEWMRMTPMETTQLKAELQEVYKQKMFQVNPSPILLKAAAPANTNPASANRFAASRRTTSRTAPGQRAANPSQPAASAATTKERPASAHATDFAKLFHSALLDHEILSRPLPDTGTRVENAEKYLSLWGAQRININTAPRHVLEAAFMLTGDAFIAPELAQKVIEQRKEKPFQNVDQLKTIGLIDSSMFDTMKNYITTTSTFFKIRVTSSSGNATAAAVATVIKEGKNVEPLAILYGY
ncbi:MAG: general secretion pathway protein GspK [Planctomycetaceae bacterium]|nr:general secretion pathway protein GspK [Planctomycetaceae bacterium]